MLLWLSERFGWLGWHKGYAVLTCVAVVGVAMLLMFLWFAVALVFRRRFQFSIRSLLALVVAAALPCSWMAVEMKKAREQRAAVLRLRASKVAVMFDYEAQWEDNLPGIFLLKTAEEPPWQTSVFGVDCFHHIDNVRAGWGTGVVHRFRFLSQVSYLTQLRSLLLGGTQVTDAGRSTSIGCWSCGSGCSAVQRSRMQEPSHLAGSPQLQILDLDGTRVTDAGLEDLTGLTQLATLDLSDTRVTDAAVAKLQQALPNCKITR